VVGGGVEAEHAELEAVLPIGLAVAAGRVAGEATQDRDDVVLEIEGARRGRAGDGDRHAERLAVELDANTRAAIGDGANDAGRTDARDGWGERAEPGRAGAID